MIVHDKFSGEVFSEFDDNNDVDELFKKAREAGSELTAISDDDINLMITEIFNIMKRKRSETAKMISAETGKPIKYSLSEDMRAETMSSEILLRNIQGRKCTLTSFSPIGTGVIIPDYNEPFLTASIQAIRAVYQRNPVMVLPYEETSASAHFLKKMFEEAGFPANSIQIISDSHICDDVRISFISSISNRKIKRPAEKKIYEEKPGISATLIWKDSDMDYAANLFSRIALENRFVRDQVIAVSEDSFEYFVNSMKEELQKKKSGNPRNYDTDIGVVTFQSEAEKASAVISQALSERSLLYGNDINGNSVPPSIFEDNSIDIIDPIYAPLFKV
ncbi:MAG: aldehyde dehydrogenase family protein, partial [Thermoplasmata archaeon]